MPVPLLTRFDLIFVVKDKPAKERDTKIAKHIINLHTPRVIDSRALIESETLTKYLTYAKRIQPILTKDAEEKILDYYMKMRSMGQDSEDTITGTPRQLEGLIRLATDRARLLLKSQVECQDAQRAIDWLESMFNEAGIDVNTGKVDLGTLQGRPRSEVSKMKLFMDERRSLEGEHKHTVEESQLVEEIAKTDKFTEDEDRKYIRKMKKD